MPIPRHFFACVLLLATVTGLRAAPRDDLLRVAPPDAALLVLVQNGHEHIRNLDQSQFGKWFPQSALGKQLLSGVDLKQAQEAAGPLFAALGIKPDELIADIFGDAVAFAFTPAPADDPKGERAVVLVRAKKPETLAKLMAKLNELQMGSGEVKAVVSRRHNGEEYFERQKPAGSSDFYCFRGGVFAFSGTEPDIQAVIDRDKSDKPSPLPDKLAKLGVADSFVIALINPRPFDAELKTKVLKANGHEKALLERFQEVWLALDSAAIDLALKTDFEIGLSLQFPPNKAPAAVKGWLTGSRQNAAIWQSIPEGALLAFAPRFKVSELIEAVGSLAAGANPLKVAGDQFLGPVFGKDKLGPVFEALGPQWALWLEPPNGDGLLPVGVLAVQLDKSGPRGKEAGREIARAVAFGFNTFRVAYNAGHTDQIELVETEGGDSVITSLVNAQGFPPGFAPSYAFKGSYLLVSTSPDAIKRFQEPKGMPSGNEAIFARFSAAATRQYLHNHREKLAKFLSAAGQGDEKDLLKQFDQASAVLELLDRIEVFTRGNDTGIRIAARIKLAKPLR